MSLVRLACGWVAFAAMLACGATADKGDLANTNAAHGAANASPSEPSADAGDHADEAGASGPAADAGSPVWVNSTSASMLHANLTRTYILDVPVGYDPARAYPLVLVFHGNPGTAGEMHALYPFDPASRGDAIVAYPQGLGNNWDLYTPGAANADIDFVKALIGEIASKRNVDRARVYGHGFSGGAFFMAQLSCRDSSVFKAVSIHSGGGPDEPQIPGAARYPNQCIQCPGGPVPVFIVHGAADTTVPSSSGDYTASCFATNNGCGETRTNTSPSPCQRYACAPDRPVEHCLVPGLGHAMWSQGTSAAWAFFGSLP